MFCIAQMDRRIAAFLEKKRLEVNHGNCREFCSKALVAQGRFVGESICKIYADITLLKIPPVNFPNF